MSRSPGTWVERYSTLAIWLGDGGREEGWEVRVLLETSLPREDASSILPECPAVIYYTNSFSIGLALDSILDGWLDQSGRRAWLHSFPPIFSFSAYVSVVVSSYSDWEWSTTASKPLIDEAERRNLLYTKLANRYSFGERTNRDLLRFERELQTHVEL